MTAGFRCRRLFSYLIRDIVLRLQEPLDFWRQKYLVQIFCQKPEILLRPKEVPSLIFQRKPFTLLGPWFFKKIEDGRRTKTTTKWSRVRFLAKAYLIQISVYRVREMAFLRIFFNRRRSTKRREWIVKRRYFMLMRRQLQYIYISTKNLL